MNTHPIKKKEVKFMVENSAYYASRQENLSSPSTLPFVSEELQTEYINYSFVDTDRETEFDSIDLGPAMVTRTVMDRVAFEHKLVVAFKIMSPLWKKALSKILKHFADYENVFISQVRLAKKLDMGLSTLKRALTAFKELGIIRWVFRGVKKTCLYTLSEHFHCKALRDKFIALVSGFKYIPMTLLLSNNAHLLAAQNPHRVANGLQCTNVENVLSKSPSLKQAYLKAEAERYASLSESNTACAREEVANAPLFLSKNKKEVEMTYSPSLAIAAAASVKSIQLTAYGKVVVGSYPADAIAFADREMAKRAGKVQKPMALFLSMCKQYCERNNARPNFSRLQEFKNNHPEWQQLLEYEVTQVPSRSDAPVKKSGLPDDFRDPATYPKVQQWIDFVLKQKNILAQGGTITSYALEEVNRYDRQQAAGGDMSTMPAQAINRLVGGDVVDPFLSLPLEHRNLIQKALAHPEVLGKSMHATVIKAQMKELLAKGAKHPLASDASFWEGLRHVSSVIDAQSYKNSSVKTVLGDVDLDVDSRPFPVDWELSAALANESNEWVEIDLL